MTPRPRLALALILLLAFGLRLWRLDFKSLWLDEAWTWAHTQKSFSDCITSEFSNPPGSFAIFWASTRLLGDSEWGLRLPSALSGVLATWLLFRLGRRLFDDTTTLIATLLYAVSAFHLQFTQEARTFGFLFCTVLASTEAVVLLLEGATIGRAAYYVVSAALGLHFHYVFGFVVLAHNAMVAWTWWGRGRRELGVLPWAGIQLATGLLFLPWFLWMISHARSVDTNYLDMPFGRLGAMLFAFTWGHRRLSLRSGKSLHEALIEHWELIAGFLIVALPLVVRGIRAVAGSLRAGTVIGMMFAVPSLLALALALAGSVRFTDYRYMGFLCPFWILLVAVGARSLPTRAWRTGAYLLIAAFSVESLHHYYGVRELANENWRDAAHDIVVRRGPGDLVCVHKPYVHVAYRFYDRDAREVLELPDRTTPDTFHKELARAVEGRPRVWLLLGHHLGPDAKVWPSAMREWFVPAGPPKHFPHPDGDLELWEFVRK